MANKMDILNVRKSIQNAVGRSVVLQTGHGTKQMTLSNCIIASAYPNVFTIQQRKEYGGAISHRTYSYSYSEVATNAVKISFAAGDSNSSASSDSEVAANTMKVSFSADDGNSNGGAVENISSGE